MADTAKATAGRGSRTPAATLPVARLCVDVPLAHLDRPFDYLVPAALADEVTVGCRVRVRFAGRLVSAFVLDRVASSDVPPERLAFVERVTSPDPVLSPELAALCRAVADRYGGTLIDVLRLAIPPRHARAEAAVGAARAAAGDASGAVAPGGVGGAGMPGDGGAEGDGGAAPRGVGSTGTAVDAVASAGTAGGVGGRGAPGDGGAPGHVGGVAGAVVGATPGSGAGAGFPAVVADGAGATVDTAAGSPVLAAPSLDGWRRYPRGPAFAEAVRAGQPARAVWQALPGEDWPARLAELAAATAATGRTAVVVVPDHRDLARLEAAAAAVLDPAVVVALHADLGPQARYRRWLTVRRGLARVVLGTRATMFAPVPRPGLLVVWDDGDDLHAEPRSPGPHTRDVLALRAHLSGAALLVGGFARTAEAQLLVDSGWAPEIVAPREAVRAAAPRVTALGEHSGQEARDPAARTARLPFEALQVARASLDGGAPVLVQVPRRGYAPSLACAACRTPARCRTCAGPLAAVADGPPRCRWCGTVEANFRCGACGGRRPRAVVVGAGRTAEELGRAFAPHPVRTSGAGEVLADVPGDPALVVCTPGAEPVAAGGYGAALLLDAWALLGRADLRAAEEALRRWMTAAALVRPAGAGGRVMVVAEAGIPTVQALVRWDPAWHAATELAARTELGFPPAVRMATLDGPPDALAEVLDTARLPASADVLGPVELPAPGTERALLRVPRADGRALAAALHEAAAVRTARKERDAIRIRLDPLDLV